MKKYLVYELIHMPRNFFNKIIKENINISTEIFFLLSEITKKFPLKTIFNVSLILLATLSEAIGIGLLIPFLEILLNNDLNNISSFSSKILIFLESYNLKIEVENFLFLFAILLVCKHSLHFFAHWQISRVMADFTYISRTKFLNNLINVKPNYIKNFSHGSLIDIINRETLSSGFIYTNICKIITAILQGAVYIAFSFFIAWKITFISVFISLFVIIFLNHFVILTKKLSLDNTITFSIFNKIFSDFLNSFKIIKIERLQNTIKLYLSKEIKKLTVDAKKLSLYKLGIVSLQNILFTLFLLLGIFFLLVHLEMSIDKIGLLGILFLRITQCFSLFQKNLQAIATYMPLYKRVNKINKNLLNKKDLIKNNNLSFKNKIELKNINYSYSNKKVLKNISLVINKGECLLIRGASGVGKTTLLDIISGLLDDFNGDIMIDGKKCNFLKSGFKKNLISYVPQEVFLYNDSVINNITNKKKYKRNDLEKILKASQAKEFIYKLKYKLKTVIGEKGGELSGGQRQRIALARALFSKPKILILDEATSNIDIKTEDKIINSIIKNFKLTLIIVSHRKNLQKFSNKVFNLIK